MYSFGEIRAADMTDTMLTIIDLMLDFLETQLKISQNEIELIEEEISNQRGVILRRMQRPWPHIDSELSKDASSAYTRMLVGHVMKMDLQFADLICDRECAITMICALFELSGQIYDKYNSI